MIKEIWNLSDDDFGELNQLIWKMNFEPVGRVKYGFGKLILTTMLMEFTNFGLTHDYSNSRIHPIFNYSNKSVIYNYKEYAELCGWKTVKTFKKYLFSLVDAGFLQIWTFGNNRQIFEVKINLDRIIKAPKIKENLNETRKPRKND